MELSWLESASRSGDALKAELAAELLGRDDMAPVADGGSTPGEARS